MRVVVVTGRSGAGKSSALGTLEDLNYYCIDNLPMALLTEAVDTVSRLTVGRGLAVSIDIRTLGQLTEMPSIMSALKRQCDDIQVVYIDAHDDVLVRRYTETRRRHPLSSGADRAHLSKALTEESQRLAPIAALATITIDSSQLSIHALRETMRRHLGTTSTTDVFLKIESFGFKHGIPLDVDTIFDARALPNPHWEPTLRSLTGRDDGIIDYLQASEITQYLLAEIVTHIRYWLPQHARAGRQYFTVGIGCTGGRHRSVYLAEQVAKALSDLPATCDVVHRELAREQVSTQ
jgi:RNase adapter protein RapZ